MSAQWSRCVRVPGRSLGTYRGHRQARTAVVCRDRVAGDSLEGERYRKTVQHRPMSNAKFIPTWSAK